ncbi:MAG: hypothetical protein WCY34_05595 [Candidatus Omnitrophota bacterium]|jgi:hypothetical protein
MPKDSLVCSNNFSGILSSSIKDLELTKELLHSDRVISRCVLITQLNNTEVKIRYIKRMLEKEKGGKSNG